ncbi:hypothetical protein [Lelliottia wanjuensis]|uniref:Uncharacterized protein n=1 Tax=Lelliottia wanjuensis TaxID=3050585 RepID=A0AAP4D6D2_9ENTR|nr:MULTISPECIES: hypothetical protein [unclassified Lelliottia]MDK9364157.1 hypothetical protein [Lelliottia sp. V106_12]MDK9585400.1 hypothetical protein [Lelliottia sp. V86_10]MDK9617166.1 hypothetical protein [Lelliottia sp. V106_9]
MDYRQLGAIGFATPKGERGNKSDYSPEFEEAWSKYSKRAGGNSVQAAFKAWNARIKSGVAVQDMIDGAVRYAAYMQQLEKLIPSTCCRPQHSLARPATTKTSG